MCVSVRPDVAEGNEVFLLSLFVAACECDVCVCDEEVAAADSVVFGGLTCGAIHCDDVTVRRLLTKAREVFPDTLPLRHEANEKRIRQSTTRKRGQARG